MKSFSKSALRVGICLFVTMVIGVGVASAETAQEIEKSAREGLKNLYATSEGAKALGATAKGVLVFPDIVKGGFVVGGQYGKGVLFRGDKVEGYFNTAAASFGMQAGVQKFGYALFFMEESDLAYVHNTEGWEIGVGPSITIVDKGMANSLTSTTLKKGVFAFFFGQKGLMAGLGVQGSKISEIYPGDK